MIATSWRDYLLVAIALVGLAAGSAAYWLGSPQLAVWLWAIALSAAVCALWVGPLGLDLPVWPTRATH